MLLRCKGSDAGNSRGGGGGGGSSLSTNLLFSTGFSSVANLFLKVHAQAAAAWTLGCGGSMQFSCNFRQKKIQNNRLAHPLRN